jgi:hypothetical protein
MVDQIRVMIMRLWELRRRICDVLQGDKLPAAVQQVVNRSRNLTHYSVEKYSLWGAEVRDIKSGRRHVVNTEEHECTCLEWQHTGMLCGHAILFLASKPKLNMDPYLHEYYSVAKFKAAYATPGQLMITPFVRRSLLTCPFSLSLTYGGLSELGGYHQISHFVAFFTYYTNDMLCFSGENILARPHIRGPDQPLVVENCWPKEKT